MIKASSHIVKGMQKDTAPSRFDRQYAFDARNIRITADETNTLLSVTNERGTRKIQLESPIEGILIGCTTVGDYIVLFTTLEGTDRIYRLEGSKDSFTSTLLYVGSLSFDAKHPIECFGDYENKDIQKVYWTDGINQPRVINAASDSPKVLDFVPDIKRGETVTVIPGTSSGSFSAGVIQYAFTYYNKYGSETAVFHTTPLLNVCPNDRGARPDETVNTSFDIHITNADTSFDYIRVYSIHRAETDAVPAVTNVIDLAVSSDMYYTDTGTTGSSVDPSLLLYIGGEDITAQTICAKDNTLFLGNIELRDSVIGEDLRNSLKRLPVGFKQVDAGDYTTGGYYAFKSSLKQKISTFHSNEWYRFGIQFQHSNGKWSEVVHIDDRQNDKYPENSGGKITVVKARTELSAEIVDEAIAQGYVKARGVVVYPDKTSREVFAQGILCPTVYNLYDRYTNSPFAQASWFSRPSINIDVSSDDSIVDNNTNIDKGAWAEFRHNKPIPDNWKRNAEIQCLSQVPESPAHELIDKSGVSAWVNDRKEYFFVDQSIVTLNSPDIEFDDYLATTDTSGLKLRVVGRVALTANNSYLDIQESTSTARPEAEGVYTEHVGVQNISSYGYRSLLSSASYIDSTAWPSTKTYSGYVYSYMTYPWHRTGSLNNDSSVSEARSAVLAQKRMSNLKYAAYTEYLARDSVWSAPNGVADVAIFNQETESLLKLKAPEGSGMESISYYGNINKVVAPTRNKQKHTFDYKTHDGYNTITADKAYGYPIVVTGRYYNENDREYSEVPIHSMYEAEPKVLEYYRTGSIIDYSEFAKSYYGTDPVSIKYKSVPHAVIVFNYQTENGRGYQTVLPALINREGTNYNGANVVYESSNAHLPWDYDCKGVRQDTVTHSGEGDGMGYLWLGELYRDNVENRFGGSTEEAVQLNDWLPAGEAVTLTKGKALEVPYTEGDTYFQRYDCLKTYPFGTEDTNSVTEIVSFMCETHINIDGRYDRNRGQRDNTSMLPSNFNLINRAYSQQDNVFTYKTLDYDRYSLDTFSNTVCWSLTKEAGALTDRWTNVILSNKLDMDGRHGEVTCLRCFNNSIFCFQRSALAMIMYNSRVQINTSDNVPIEIANSAKVDGSRYISTNVGCANKWSVVSGLGAMYFIDSESSSVWSYAEGLSSLSDNKGMSSWFKNADMSTWDPVTFKGFISYFDKRNRDIYFINGDTSVVYSELLGSFTSFMDYGQVPVMLNYKDSFYSIYLNRLWRNRAGEYNMLYGEYKPYSITFISNEDSVYDKIFNNIEYRADCYNGDTLSSNTFDTLEVWNEYQRGVTVLDNSSRTSGLQKKFRVWRSVIPRANRTQNGVEPSGRDRIRNTWAYIKLSKEKENTEKMVFHDLLVKYFI